MVFNIGKDSENETVITTRMATAIERPWPVRVAKTKAAPPLSKKDIAYYKSASAEASINPSLNTRIFGHVNNSDQCQAYEDSEKSTNDK